MTQSHLLHVQNLSLDAPGGRPLFRDLSMTLDRGERVALVGRNGVGKSSLLDVLAGRTVPERGEVRCVGRRMLVPQLLAPTSRTGVTDLRSPGERRRAALEEARRLDPDLLLLDEPTHDLDSGGLRWLLAWLRDYDGGLLVVSHDRRVLRAFDAFFLASESGCRHFAGSFDELVAHLEREDEEEERRYVRALTRLAQRERKNDRVRQRRARKKALGRLHELRRCPSRSKLNENRSYAQESQGKRAVLQRARIEAARAWTLAARRAVAVELPLELELAPMPPTDAPNVVRLEDVSARRGGRALFEGVGLELCRERLAISGANGAGKSTLVEILVGERAPDAGRARCERGRIGYVAQEATNWRLESSLFEELGAGSADATAEKVASMLRAHRFPLALAARPLASLSPGERLRAALICLCQRRPAPEMLVLDEPTDHLDLTGTVALERVLRAWPGGLVLVTHDRTLLDAVGVDRELRLDTPHPGAEPRLGS